jgi:hypothetical protein
MAAPFPGSAFADISTLHLGRDMKCNLAAPTLLSIVPASSLAPLALGAVAIASALAAQRLDIATARGGRHGRRSRGRTGARTDRRAEKEDRRPAATAAVGLPEATAEIIASLGEHRVLSTEQVRTIHLPGRSLRRTQQILAGIEEAGLIHHVDARIAPRRLWFVGHLLAEPFRQLLSDELTELLEQAERIPDWQLEPGSAPVPVASNAPESERTADLSLVGGSINEALVEREGRSSNSRRPGARSSGCTPGVSKIIGPCNPAPRLASYRWHGLRRRLAWRLLWAASCSEASSLGATKSVPRESAC